MSDYLEDLGRELDRAAARRVAGRRPRRPLLPALAALAAVAAVAVVLLARGGAPVPSDERPAATDAPVAAASFPHDPAPPPAELRAVPVTIANGTTVVGLGASFADELELAGWEVTDPINAASTDETGSYVAQDSGAPRQAAALAEALGLPLRDEPDLGAEQPVGPVVVLGSDANPSPPAQEVRARPAETPGGACLDIHVPGGAVATKCGVAPTVAEPLGLVTVDVLPGGGWLVYGYASDQTAKVQIGPDITQPTVAKEGVPGRYFERSTTEMQSVYVAALDAGGAELGSVGSLQPSHEKLTSMDQALAVGDISAFSPSIDVDEQKFILDGEEIAPGEAARRGLSCELGDGHVVHCTDPQARP